MRFLFPPLDAIVVAEALPSLESEDNTTTEKQKGTAYMLMVRTIQYRCAKLKQDVWKCCIMREFTKSTSPGQNTRDVCGKKGKHMQSKSAMRWKCGLAKSNWRTCDDSVQKRRNLQQGGDSSKRWNRKRRLTK
jgi:hypothetical protein